VSGEAEKMDAETFRLKLASAEAKKATVDAAVTEEAQPPPALGMAEAESPAAESTVEMLPRGAADDSRALTIKGARGSSVAAAAAADDDGKNNDPGHRRYYWEGGAPNSNSNENAGKDRGRYYYAADSAAGSSSSSDGGSGSGSSGGGRGVKFAAHRGSPDHLDDWSDSDDDQADKNAAKGKEENAAKGKEATKAWKRRIRRVVDSAVFNYFILFCIVASSIILATESPAVEPSQDTKDALYVVDIFFTCAFTGETVMKILGYGLWAHGHGYLADPFNVSSQ
jgi:hypothetical protein